MVCALGNRKTLTPILIVLAMLLLIKFTSSQTWSLSTITTPQQEPFQVSAQGEVYIQPDTAQITIGVEKNAKTVVQAQEEINEVNNQIINNLKDLGIKEEKIKTTQYSINPLYEWNRATGKRSLNGYQAMVRILVKTRDFDKINQIVDKSTEAGATNIGELSFIIEDEDTAKAEARELAIEKAKEKAKSIASAANMTLGRIINVSVSDAGYYNNYRDYAPKGMGIGEAEMEQTQIQVGENKVTVNVTLSYEIK